MNNLEHLKPLSKLKSSKGIEFVTPMVSPGNHCPMRMASVISREIKGLSTLLVGMEECTIHSRLFTPYPEGDDGELHWLYLLDSNEVVFGCKKGVMEAIEIMSLKGIKHLMLIITCVPELIGEDIEGLAIEASEKYNMKVGFVKLGQFKNVSFPPGFRKTLEELVKFMDEKDVNKNKVNILGRKEDEDHIVKPKFIEILEKTHEINYLAPGSSIEDFENCSDAALNIVVSSHVMPMAVEMERKLSMKYISLYDKYSSMEINSSYAEIDKILSSKLEVSSIEESKLLNDLEEEIKSKLCDRSYVLGDRADNNLSFAKYLNDLGMKSEFIHLEDFYEEDKNKIKEILEQGVDPLVGRIVNIDEDTEAVKDIRPDIWFGFMSKSLMEEMQISNMMVYYGQVGNERSLNILNDILKQIEGRL